MPLPSISTGRGGDARVIDLIRLSETVGVADLAEALGVTATAARLRLERLVREGFVERTPAEPRPSRGRGRPANGYRLTPRGRRAGGDNFHDLAMVLWDEVRSIREPSIRRGLLSRIGRRLADRWAAAINSDTAHGRLEQVADLLRERSVRCGVSGDAEGRLAVLTSHSCPYPDLAERDRGICAAERDMLERLTGASVKLTECRLDGDACCRFTFASSSAAAVARPTERPGGSRTASDQTGAERPSEAPLLASEGDCPSNSPRDRPRSPEASAVIGARRGGRRIPADQSSRPFKRSQR